MFSTEDSKASTLMKAICYRDAKTCRTRLFSQVSLFARSKEDSDDPVLATVVALGVLVQTAPWVIAWMGFAELGPVEGSFAAWWMAEYAGYVPKGSLFSFFQRLGMVWKGNVMMVRTGGRSWPAPNRPAATPKPPTAPPAAPTTTAAAYTNTIPNEKHADRLSIGKN